MGIETKYYCDVKGCNEVVTDERKVSSINFNSVFGTPVVKKILCKKHWKEFIKRTQGFFKEE